MTEVPAVVVDELKKSAPWIATMAVFAFLIGVVSLGTFVFTLVRSHDQPAGQVALLSLTYGPWSSSVLYWDWSLPAMFAPLPS